MTVIPLWQASTELCARYDELPQQPPAKLIEGFLHQFTMVISRLERYYSREEILREISPLRTAIAASPFMHRAQTWPRGYPGDFETIDYVLNGRNKAEPGSKAWHIEEYFLNSPICAQHYNKVKVQSRLIRETVQRNPQAQILSIGCGTSEDLVQTLPMLQASDCRISLLDTDQQALEYSAHRLQSVNDRLHLQQGNIYKLAKKLDSSFDLIIIGGVFDYLSNRVIGSLLDHLAPQLRKDGVLYFSNIGKHNPYRVCMEYLSDWLLIERTEEDIRTLLNNTAAANLQCHLAKDATSLTWLATLHSGSSLAQFAAQKRHPGSLLYEP